jgi:hypothetical protein
VVLVELQTNPELVVLTDVPVVLAAAAVNMAAVVVVDFINHRVLLTVGLPAVLVQSVLFGPVQLVPFHQPTQGICKWNFIFASKTD